GLSSVCLPSRRRYQTDLDAQKQDCGYDRSIIAAYLRIADDERSAQQNDRQHRRNTNKQTPWRVSGGSLGTALEQNKCGKDDDRQKHRTCNSEVCIAFRKRGRGQELGANFAIIAHFGKDIRSNVHCLVRPNCSWHEEEKDSKYILAIQKIRLVDEPDDII